MKIEIILALVLISVFVIDYLIKKKKSKSASEIEKRIEGGLSNKKKNKWIFFLGLMLVIIPSSLYFLGSSYFMFDDDMIEFSDYFKYKRINVFNITNKSTGIVFNEFGNVGIIINGNKNGLWKNYNFEQNNGKYIFGDIFSKQIKAYLPFLLSETLHKKNDDKATSRIVNWWYFNGNIRQQGNFKNYKKEGLEKQWYRNGNLKREINYKNDIKHGSDITLHENGEKAHIISYNNGKKVGEELKISKNGDLYYQCQYNEKGEKDGIEKQLGSNNGELYLSDESYYKNGKRHGTQKMYFINGKISSLKNFRNGVEHGDFKVWCYDGTLRQTGVYINGKNDYSLRVIYNLSCN